MFLGKLGFCLKVTDEHSSCSYEHDKHMVVSGFRYDNWWRSTVVTDHFHASG